jgi:hypothetical protein
MEDKIIDGYIPYTKEEAEIKRKAHKYIINLFKEKEKEKCQIQLS